MFCPRCGTENDDAQKYCRQCGLPFSPLRLAREGRAESALTLYKNGSGSVAAGAITLTVCVLVAVLNVFMSSGPRNYGVLVNLLIGLSAAVPMMILGIACARRAERLLEGQCSSAGDLLKNRDHEPELPLPIDHETNLLPVNVAALGSVMEATTHQLKVISKGRSKKG